MQDMKLNVNITINKQEQIKITGKYGKVKALLTYRV